MPYYRDVAAYNGLEIAFFKRAQLAAADLALALYELRERAGPDAACGQIAPSRLIRCSMIWTA